MQIIIATAILIILITLILYKVNNRFEKKEFLCAANEVEINRIQDNFVFKNFLNLKEECIEK